MHEVKIIIDDATRELLEDAAKRADKSFDSILRDAVEGFANIEYARQQNEDAKTC